MGEDHPAGNSIRLRKACEGDAAAMTRCALSALASNPVSRGLHGPTGTSPAAEASMERDMLQTLRATARDPIIRYVVAENIDRALVGCAKWHFHPAASVAGASPASMFGSHGSLATAFFGGGHELRQRNIRGRPCAMLTLLAVDPAQRARGIGAALVRWGLQRADAAGLDCWLVCTPAAYRLYATCGFQDVDLMDLDLLSLASVKKHELGEDWGEGLAHELRAAPPVGHYRAVLMSRKSSGSINALGTEGKTLSLLEEEGE